MYARTSKDPSGKGKRISSRPRFEHALALYNLPNPIRIVCITIPFPIRIIDARDAADSFPKALGRTREHRFRSTRVPFAVVITLPIEI